MKIIDMHLHTHSNGLKPEPKKLVSELNKAGIYGAGVFSVKPEKPPFENVESIEKRTSDILTWCEGYTDVLYPVLYIHPYEENVIEEVKKASERGIVAFKMICNTYYVSEQKSMDLLNAIAELDKPVIFHSGILWDGLVSSEYNKPVNWEALLDIPNLRFSMGHCSWPWIDECIALYGKFLNAYTRRSDISSEMFFDITPGTPEIYRRELLTKLFTIGYDVEHNIMFGLDNKASEYNYNRAKDWLVLDKEIMDDLKVPYETREKLYCENFMRFIGKTKKEISRILPTADSTLKWKV